MLNLQTFLREGNSPDDVTEKYAVVTRRHNEYNNLVLFKYSMIDSPLGDPLVQECRGIILDEDNDWAIVSYPYNKFFNHGEANAHDIDWGACDVYEKADGSLMTLYFYDDKWHIASSGSPDASGEVYGTGMTFKELFWKTWDDLGYTLPVMKDDIGELNPTCFMFELCTKYNKIVVQHPKSRIISHGARRLNDLQEMWATAIAGTYKTNWEEIKRYPFNTLEEILATCDAIKPHEGEGYVICDENFNRIKVKTPQYVAISHLRDGMGSRRMLEIVRIGEGEEVLAHFPEFQSLYNQIDEKYNEYVEEVSKEWDKVKGMPVGNEPERRQWQKNFAMAIKDVPCKGVLFGMRDGKYKTIREALLEMNIKYLMEILKVKDLTIDIT